MFVFLDSILLGIRVNVCQKSLFSQNMTFGDLWWSRDSPKRFCGREGAGRRPRSKPAALIFFVLEFRSLHFGKRKEKISVFFFFWVRLWG